VKTPSAATTKSAATGTAPRGAALVLPPELVPFELPELVELTEFALIMADPPIPVEFLHWSSGSSFAEEEKVMSAH
jgi:hypothetical protein